MLSFLQRLAERAAGPPADLLAPLVGAVQSRDQLSVYCHSA